MKKTFKLLKLLFLPITLFVFLSCKTLPPERLENLFGLIGNGADVYIFIPVTANKTLTEAILPFGASSGMKKALSRTNTVCSGFFVKDSEIEIRICTEGNYPHVFSDSFFKKSDGWTHERTSQGHKYYSSPYMDISLPKKNMAVMNFGSSARKSMEETLSFMEAPETVYFPPAFDRLLKNTPASGKIGLFINNADFFISKILGIKLGFPILKIEVYLSKAPSSRKEMYDYNIDIEVGNSNTGFAARLLLSKLLKTEVKIDGNKITVENGKVSAEKLINIVKSVYK